MKNLFLTIAFILATTFSFADTNTNENTTKEVVFMECFDFNDSCGGSWEVCHEGVTTAQLTAFLFEWDGGC